MTFNLENQSITDKGQLAISYYDINYFKFKICRGMVGYIRTYICEFSITFGCDHGSIKLIQKGITTPLASYIHTYSYVICFTKALYLVTVNFI